MWFSLLSLVFIGRCHVFPCFSASDCRIEVLGGSEEVGGVQGSLSLRFWDDFKLSICQATVLESESGLLLPEDPEEEPADVGNPLRPGGGEFA